MMLLFQSQNLLNCSFCSSSGFLFLLQKNKICLSLSLSLSFLRQTLLAPFQDVSGTRIGAASVATSEECASGEQLELERCF